MVLRLPTRRLISPLFLPLHCLLTSSYLPYLGLVTEWLLSASSLLNPGLYPRYSLFSITWKLLNIAWYSVTAAASTLYSNHHKKRLPCTVQLPLANLIQFDTLTIPLSPIDLISPTRKLLDLSLCYKDVGVGLLNSNQASSLLTINVTANYHISISQPTQHKSFW